MKTFIRIAALLILFTAGLANAQKLTKTWTPLLGKDLNNWDVFIGTPNDSLVKAGYKKGKPLGLNNDPLKIYTLENTPDGPLLHISGVLYGGLSTKTEYENYHLKLEFKWGVNKYTASQKRDNGVLYHATGEHGKFASAWMASQEMQVQEGDIGDFYALAGTTMDIRAVNPTGGKNDWVYNPDGELHTFSEVKQPSNNVRHIANYEKPYGEWNTLELFCIGNKSVHVVNGHVVMVLENSRIWQGDKEVPLTKGKIQLQSEGAEAYYRNIMIRGITKLPAEIAKQIKQ